jgi:B12-binding domain/radical SAM domain protein
MSKCDSKSKYDVILIHPPAIYDFRKKTFFTGALGSSVEQIQFTKVPIGMLSIADYLDRHGYKVIIDNLGDRMVQSQDFDAVQHIKNMDAKVFAIGLHFQHHSQGAIEIARLCKKLHPASLVVVGGLTATRFHEEIIQKYKFVDAVIRGEAEKPFLEFMNGLKPDGGIKASPNLTYRNQKGETVVTALMPPSKNLDEYEYTRFDLLEPKISVYGIESKPRWSLVVGRGCVYNCSICGGSAYSYKTYLGMDKPSFRSPAKIVEDIKRLNSQGIRNIGLYQDPRMGGKKYAKELIEALKGETLNMDRLSLDLLVPADEEFIKSIADIGRQVIVHICPDSGCDAVRKKLGRPYSTEELLETIQLCHKYLIPVTTFFSVGLAGETRDQVLETLDLWAELSSLDTLTLAKTNYWELGCSIPVGGPIMGPIVLDPGSLAFDSPEKFGYKLKYKTLEAYIQGLSEPSWHQWLNYETDLLTLEEIVALIMESVDFSIDTREQFGFYEPGQAEFERLKLKADLIAITEVNRIMSIKNTEERESALRTLKNKLDSLLQEYLGRNQKQRD